MKETFFLYLIPYVMRNLNLEIMLVNQICELVFFKNDISWHILILLERVHE